MNILGLRYWETSAFGPFMERALKAVQHRSIPVFRSGGGALTAGGTSIPLRVGERSFLITASHVIRPFLDGSLRFCIGSGQERGSVVEVPLNKAVFSESRSGRLSEDKHDLGVIPLEQRVADRLSASYRFTTLEEVHPPYSPGPSDWLGLHGFPKDLAKKVANPDMPEIKFTDNFGGSEPVRELRGKLARWPGTRPVVAVYRREATFGTNGTDAPDPDGMSGGPMWLLTRNREHVSDWSESEIRLVGVMIEWKGTHGLIVGTRAADVAPGIRHFFPDTAGAFDAVPELVNHPDMVRLSA